MRYSFTTVGDFSSDSVIREFLAMTMLRFTKRSIESQTDPDPEKPQALYWDTALRGFGLVVGQTCKTYVVQKRGMRHTIGRADLLTLDDARRKAHGILSRLSDPTRVTLTDAMEQHVANMRKKQCVQRTIDDLEHDVKTYLADWLDRPLAEIRKSEAVARHEKLTNKHGPYLANHVLRYFRACFNTALQTTDLSAANPCFKMVFNKERRVQAPIPWAKLPEWRAKVEA